MTKKKHRRRDLLIGKHALETTSPEEEKELATLQEELSGEWWTPERRKAEEVRQKEMRDAIEFVKAYVAFQKGEGPSPVIEAKAILNAKATSIAPLVPSTSWESQS